MIKDSTEQTRLKATAAQVKTKGDGRFGTHRVYLNEHQYEHYIYMYICIHIHICMYAL